MSTIEAKYARLGGQQSFLGSPVGEEHTGLDRIGRLRRFQGGVICAHPAAGVHEIHGEILQTWLEMGAEKSTLGYPTSDVLASGVGRRYCSCFSNGRIYLETPGSLHITDLYSDKSVLEWIAFRAAYLPINWVEINGFAPPPALIDYSRDIVFTRTQNTQTGGGYGCITYAYLHILDIIKHWEQPFSPHASWHYAEWFNEMYQAKTWPFSGHGVAPEGLCHTNWDTEFHFGVKTNADNKPEPIILWDKPDQKSQDAVSLYRVKPISESIAAKPKGTSSGLLSPSVQEIKQLLCHCGPVLAFGWGHAKAIIGFDDLKSEFKILDSYLHAEPNDNCLSISYSKIGPAKLFDIPSEYMDVLLHFTCPHQLIDDFRAHDWPISDQVIVTASNEQYLLYAKVDNSYHVFSVPRDPDNPESSTPSAVYDYEMIDSYSVDNFVPMISLYDAKRLEAPFAYSARIRIANNWRGTYTVSVGVEGQEALTVWTTRGRNLQNVKKTIAGTKVSWETPVEVTSSLDIDVPLPAYAKDYWPPRSSPRWVLTVEDHDRDGVTGILKEFTLAKLHIHPDCHSVGKYQTETYGGQVSIPLQDPATGQEVGSALIEGMENPPAIANPKPGVVNAYIQMPATAQLRQQPRYSVELDEDAYHSSAGRVHIAGRLMVNINASTQPLASKEVKLMQLDLTTCKPYQWLPVSETLTRTDGRFDFHVEAIILGKVYLGVAFFGGLTDQPLASSEVIDCGFDLHMPPRAVVIHNFKRLQPPVPWPWDGPLDEHRERLGSVVARDASYTGGLLQTVPRAGDATDRVHQE